MFHFKQKKKDLRRSYTTMMESLDIVKKLKVDKYGKLRYFFGAI